MSFWFEYEDNGDRQTFSFDGGSVSIGRDQSQDFVLDHPTVSREHAMIIDDGGGQFRLVVLSQNGLTAVDGERVESEADLYDGTQLHFGKLSFQFRSDQAPSSSAGGGTQGQVRQQTGGGQGADVSTGGSGPAMPDGGGPADVQTSDTVSSSERAGIESWDEIAQSAGEDDEDQQQNSQQQSSGPSTSRNAQPEQVASQSRSNDSGEETNPIVVVVGIIGIVGLLGYSFWPAGGGQGPSTSDPLEEEDSEMLVSVECLSEKKCLNEAKASYQVGTEYLAKQDSGVANLFKGYKRLLESQAYLEQGEIGTTPKEMSDLQPQIDKARDKLDQIFRNYQVKFRSAQKNDQSREMADALRTIQRYFPDKSAPEYKWAQEHILQMKQKGNYPNNF